MTKSSLRPGPDETYFVELASRFGKQVGDVSWAHATTTTDEVAMVIEATRVVGADAGQIRDFMLEASGLTGPPSQDVVGGKAVVVVTNDLGSRTYLYASGDVLYRVDVLADASVAADVLAALP